jgi:hypothetical protein
MPIQKAAKTRVMRDINWKKWTRVIKKGPNIRQTGKQWNKGNSLQQKETVEIIVGAAQRIPRTRGVKIMSSFVQLALCRA